MKHLRHNEYFRIFERITANDPSIETVDLENYKQTTGLDSLQQDQAGANFSRNTHVKTMRFIKVGMGDAFAKALANSLESNMTLKIIVLDKICISG